MKFINALVVKLVDTKDLNTKAKANLRTHMVPTTPDEVLKRIMTDFSTHLRRSKETYAISKEMPKFPMVDYEELMRIVQSNFHCTIKLSIPWSTDT